MSNQAGESLPEPDPEPSPYLNALFSAHDSLRIFPPYPKYVNDTREFEMRLFDDYENIEIEASIYGSLIDNYLKLDKDQQFDLADHVVYAIGKTAGQLYGHNTIHQRETVVLINNLPVMFEPTNNAMLVGQWEDWERKKMNIRSQFIETRDQQRMLLGGLAALVTYLEQQ
jgi:hypothetical protein